MQAAKRRQRVPTATGESRNILVVDDDGSARESMLALLEGAGYKAIGVANGAEALTSLRGGVRPFLILLDLRMPVMDGWQFRAEQARGEFASIPVVVISAEAERDVTGLRATDTMRKPVDGDLLLGVVAKHRQRAPL
jgi:CheY-like chemotaxis protein